MYYKEKYLQTIKKFLPFDKKDEKVIIFIKRNI